MCVLFFLNRIFENIYINKSFLTILIFDLEFNPNSLFLKSLLTVVIEFSFHALISKNYISLQFIVAVSLFGCSNCR